VAAWVVALGLLGVTLLRWSGHGTRFVLVVACSTAAPVLLLPSYLLALTALLTRRAALGAVATVLVVAHLLVSWPLWFGGRGLTAAQRAPSAIRIRVYALNVSYTTDDGAAISAQIRRYDPDLVVLSEFSALTQRHLDIDRKRLVYAWWYPRSGGGVALYSRWRVRLSPPHSDEVPYYTGSMNLDGNLIDLVQVHTLSPTSGHGTAVWAGQLSSFDRLFATYHAPTIIAGDFNASRSDASFSALLGGPDDFADAAAGRGYLPTWPSGKALVPPFMQLDHVLVSREFGVRDTRVLGPVGSDHRAVLTDLSFVPP
jgi:endonuclease/exonuclease/phosphatase (EEP) superfamily protein YafD